MADTRPYDRFSPGGQRLLRLLRALSRCGDMDDVSHVMEVVMEEAGINYVIDPWNSLDELDEYLRRICVPLL